MANINIDGTDYDYDTLSDSAKTQIANLRATEAELARQQSLVAMLQAARLKYIDLLKSELPEAEQKKPAPRKTTGRTRSKAK